MEGFSVLAIFLAAVIGLVMLFAQVKLFAIANTLEQILAELRKNSLPSIAAPQSQEPSAQPHQPAEFPQQTDPVQTRLDKLSQL